MTLPTTGALTNMVDVFLLFDDTGSFTSNSPIVRAAFPNIIAQLQSRLTGIDLGFGVGRLEEYGSFASEYANGRPFILNQPIVAADVTGFEASIQSALDRVAPGYGGDTPETVIEALYQMVTGAGFDGNNDGDTVDSGAAGLASTQTNPGSSGDVPAFSSFMADPANGVLPASGTIGGAGFRSGALPIIITATDTGFAYQPKGETTITGIDGVTLPVSAFTGTSRGTTPFSSGAGIQETVTGLNALGALVIGLGTADAATAAPRSGLEALATMTGAINQTATTIANGTADPIATGDPFYFKIGSGGDPLVGNIADGIVAAIDGAVTSVNVNVTLRASDPRVHISFNPGVINGLGAGDTATFDVTFTGDGRPTRFDLQFIREGTDVVLGSIPVVLGTPVAGEDYEYEDCEDGEHSSGVDFGNQRLDGFVPNVAPSFVIGADLSVAEDSGDQTVAAWATDISPGSPSEASQLVNFVVSNDNNSLFAVQPAISADGTLTYTPAANANGSTVVTIQLHDNGGTALGGVDTSAPQQFTITISAVNDATTAEDDSYSMNEDEVLTVAIAAEGVLSNDTDIDSPPSALKAFVSANPSHGSIVLNEDGTFSYTPALNFNGNDTFTYYVNDGSDNSNTATVEITVRPVNDVPTGLPTIGVTETGSVTFPVGTSVNNIFNIGSMSSVVERNGYSFTMSGANTYGLVSINNANVDGAHPDGGGLLMRQSDYGRYPVVVRRIDGQPFGIRTAAIREDSTASGLQIPIAGVSHETGVAFSYDFIFDRDPATFDIFDFAATDGRFLSVDYLVISPVESTVIEPIITTHIIDSLDLFTLSAPSVVQSGNLLTANTGDISDVDGLGAFSYQWLRDGVAIVDATSDAYLVGDGDSGALISVRVMYTDGGGTLETLTSAAVGPVGGSNSAPTGQAVIVGSAIEDQALSVDVSSIADVDGLGAFSYVWSTGATTPSIVLGDSDVDQNIAVTVSYTDGAGKVEYVTSAQFGPVANVNDVPTGTVLISGIATEGEILTADVSGITDADGLGAFSYLWSNGATAPSITLANSDVGSNITVTVSYTDGHGTAESLTSAPVGPVVNMNDAPVSNSDAYTIDADTILIVSSPGILANDSDIDGDALTAVLVAGPSNGTLTLNSDGSLIYTPATGFSGSDSFTYVANDGFLDSNEATVFITVNPVLPPPTGDVHFLVVDASSRRTFEYDNTGGTLTDLRLNKEDEKPMGIAVNNDGSLRWVVDGKGEVFVYNNRNILLGSFEIGGVDKAQGITINGSDLLIVDSSNDRVYIFAGAADRRSGKANPSSSFALNRANRNATDLVTDGNHIWIVNDTSASDKVFRYSMTGQLEGSWTIDPANTKPTGITLAPGTSGDIWIVDSLTNLAYGYIGAAELTSGSATAASQFALNSLDGNAQGIAAVVLPATETLPATGSVAIPIGGARAASVFAADVESPAVAPVADSSSRIVEAEGDEADSKPKDEHSPSGSIVSGGSTVSREHSDDLILDDAVIDEAFGAGELHLHLWLG
ncbi:MAG: tandem-95 repeat protein [Planctomycetaceae bacterium]|nr:tandem-95 repeat protein [Planctomycetaceae bacterium]